MKNIILIFIAAIIVSCSFDNKTGIWKDITDIEQESQEAKSVIEDKSTPRYESIFTKNQIFNEEKKLLKGVDLGLEEPTVIYNWPETYGTKNNNFSNFAYSASNTLISKSKKLSNSKHKSNFLFYENNLISYDHKGKIFIYSLKYKKKLFEFNFYKKNFKNFKKEIYIAVEKNILYAADNLGYMYAIDLNRKKLIWAKNFGIPFRSNIKIVGKQIFLANQDNVIYSVDTENGDKNWRFSSSITFLKSDFINNFSIDKRNNLLFFINTSGELYSINYLTQKINWVLNFKDSSSSNVTDLFLSQPIVIKNNNLLISTDNAIISYNTLSGTKNWNFPSNSILKPVVTENYTYIFSKNKLLICIENITGEVLWSKNIYNSLNNKIKNKIVKFTELKIANSKLNLFSESGYLLNLNHNGGKVEYVKQISKNGINSEIIFINNNMFLIDKKNRLLKFN